MAWTERVSETVSERRIGESWEDGAVAGRWPGCVGLVAWWVVVDREFGRKMFGFGTGVRDGGML